MGRNENVIGSDDEFNERHYDKLPEIELSFEDDYYRLGIYALPVMGKMKGEYVTDSSIFGKKISRTY